MNEAPSKMKSRFSMEEDEPPNTESKNTELNASLFSVSFIILSVAIVTLAITINGLLPEPLNTKDVPAKSQQFVAERAYTILKQLSGIGPKVIGTYENEVLAVELIKKEINKVVEERQNTVNDILYNIQTVSGCFNLTIKNIAKTLCYQNVQNIVVKLQSARAAESILLNCHFDSVPTSPGASDNGLHCSVLLELLRVLANVDHSLNRNVVFLFNGAEEGGLLGSHGFVSKHKWFEDIITFVNLDACGAGGREILFQTGPRAYVLPKIYAQSVPYPHGAVFGEELFQTGVLPSDTDFRIFRDFGHLKGLDLAHYKNGYVYHTSSDNISYISRNVIQHSGDNLLALTRALVQYDNLKEAIFETNDQAVYLDVFGKFMIYYSTTVAYFFNIFTIFLSIYSSGIIVIKIFKGMKMRYIYYHFLVNFLFMGVGRFVVLVTLFLLAYLLELYDKNMLWYSNQWFVASYYGVAALYLTTTLLKMRQSFIPSNLNAEAESDLFIIIIQMINTFFLFIGTVLRIRSIFVFAVGLIPISISHVILNKTSLKDESVSRKTFVYTVFNFVPSLYATYLYLQITALLIPMMGRIGSTFNSEMVIWVLCEFFIYFIFSYMEPLVLLVKNWWKVQLSFGLIFIAYIIAILYGDFLSPFADETPQRFIAVHVNRKFARAENLPKIETNGFMLVPMDQQGPRTISRLFKNENFKPIGKEICQKELFCGIPPVAPFVLRYGDSVHWKESEKAEFPQGKDVTHRITESGQFKSFHINMTDSGFADIIILPMNGAEIVEWSLFSGKPSPNLKWLNNTTYMIRRYRGLPETQSWSFSIKFDTSKMWNSSPTFKLAASVYHLSKNSDQYSPKFRQIIETFPVWTRHVAWLIDYEEYLF